MKKHTIKEILTEISDYFRHFFHVISNVRPLVWICVYLCLIPVFALIYWALPDAQFHIPDQGGTDYGSWLYYSIVTISTLGFGDYTPAHGWAQAVTAIEVMCGLSVFGFFLNAVGSMKSEIDVESAIEKQKRLHEAEEKEKLLKNIPVIIHNLNVFLAYCYAVTTPADERKDGMMHYDADFRFRSLRDLFKPSDLPIDHSSRPAVEGLMKCANNVCLLFDSLQTRVDLTLWPKLLEGCFSFVANSQMFISGDDFSHRLPRRVENGKRLTADEEHERLSKEIAGCHEIPSPREGTGLSHIVELYYFIKDNAEIAQNLEVACTELATEADANGFRN